MRLLHTGVGVLALVLLASTVPSQTSGEDAPRVEVSQRPAISTLNGFVENRGQWPDDVRFLARENGIEAVLLDDALVLHPMPKPVQPWRPEHPIPGEELADEWDFAPPPAPEPVPGPPLTIRFPGTQSLIGEGVLPTAHHYLLGSGLTRDVPGYERVVFREAAPGIDVVVRTGGGWFAYDLHVAPGADLAALYLEIEGATDAQLIADGVLALQTEAGRVEMRIGASWEVDPTNDQRVVVESRFRVLDNDAESLRLGFDAPTRDPARAFVLDPSLVYATYLGGSAQNTFIDMDVSPDGAVYIGQAGFAPTTPGAFQPEPPGVWVGKLSPDGSTLEWGTYLGGTGSTILSGVEVDQDGTVVVFGHTWAADFPVTVGSLDTVNTGAPSTADLYITRLAADGGSLVWSTYYGEAGSEHSRTLALMPSGDPVIVAAPGGPVLPATPGAFDEVYDTFELIIARMSADGTQIVFQSYFGGSAHDVAFDADSNIYITGGAGDLYSSATPGAYKETVVPGTFDAHVTKINPQGSEVLWATFLGGDEGTDIAQAIGVDASGSVYTAGSTFADDFPVTTGAPGANGLNGFVTKLLPGGSGLVWSRSLSACCGKSTDLTGLEVDQAGNAIVSGHSNSAGFPITPDALQPTYNGGTADVHLTELDALGEAAVYSTYFGGNSVDVGSLIGLDANQTVHLAMQTTSTNIPVTPGVHDPEYSGGGDVVVASFSMPVAPWRVLGGGVAGTKDTPNLAGAGDLAPGSITRVRVRGGEPTAAAVLTVGFPAHQFPWRGGLSLAPTGLAVSLTTNAQGALDLSFPWPTLPAGLRLTAQIWIRDEGAPGGWSATNKLRLISQ